MTGDPIDQILKLLRSDRNDGNQDGLVFGANAQSDKPVIYIDPAKIDLNAFKAANHVLNAKIKAQLGVDITTISDEDKKKKMYADFAKKDPEAWNTYNQTLAALIAPQLDNQLDRLSSRISRENLALFTAAILTDTSSGPSANPTLIPGLCVVVKDNQFEAQIAFQRQSGFKQEHLIQIPIPNHLFREAVGRHEGAHCAQTVTFLNTPYSDLEALKLELSSDDVMIAFFHKIREPEMAQAWIDLRALEAANTFTFLMINAVSERLNLSFNEAFKLRTEDPQKFATVVEKALKEGAFSAPKTHPATPEELVELVARETGLTREDVFDFNKNPDDFSEATKEAIQKALEKIVKEELHLIKEYPNPHVAAYIENYVGAVHRLVIPDTTPKAAIKPEAAPAEKPEFTPAEAPTSSLSTTGNYDYLAGMLPKLNGGKPEIEVTGLRDQMKIAGLSASDYFACQADCGLAEQQIALKGLTAQFALTTTTPSAKLGAPIT